MSKVIAPGISVVGPEHGSQVVLLHSSQSASSQWRALVAELSVSCRCILVDLIGYGKAPSVNELYPELESANEFRLQHETERLLAALPNSVKQAETLLVGHSYGGAVALKLAADNLLNVRALALYEPVAFHILATESEARQEIIAVAEQMSPDDAIDATRCFVDYWNQDGYFAALPHKIQQLMISQADKVRHDFSGLLNEPKTLEDYGSLSVPSLIISGLDSRLSAQVVAQQLVQTLPMAQLQNVKAGHMGPITHVSLINPILTSFLQQYF